MGPTRLQKLMAICLISSTAPQAYALVAAVDVARDFGLVTRDTFCGGVANLTQCGFGLPTGWCCPAKTQCLVLNNTATLSAICCPIGSDCSSIQKISCNTTAYDAITSPSQPLHMADTKQKLPTCDNQCCPLGYRCGNNNVCQMLESTRQGPNATDTPTSSSASSMASTSASSVGHSDSGGGVTAAGFAAGFFPGIAIGAILAVATIYFLQRRHRQQHNRQSKDTIFGNVKPDRTISDPIYDPQMAARTDFLSHSRNRSVEKSPSMRSAPEFQSAQNFSAGVGRPTTSSSTSTLTTARIYSQKRDNLATPTPAPRDPRQNSTMLASTISPRPPATSVKPIRGLFSKSPSLRRKRGSSNLGPGQPPVKGHRSTSSGETIEVSMGSSYPGQQQTLQTGSVSRGKYDFRDSSYPESSRGNLTATYSQVFQAAGASASQFGTPKSPEKSEEVRVPKLGSPWKPSGGFR